MRLVRCSRLLCSTAHLIIYPYDSVLRVPAQELQRHPPGKTCGLERPPRFPWQRSGVAPDHFSASPASKLRVAPCATSMLSTISPRPWVTLTVTGMVTSVFHAPVTFPREKRPLNLTMILSPSTPTEAAETKNVKGKSRPAPKRARAPIVFDRRFWTTPGIFDPPASMQQLPNAPPRNCV